MDRRTTVFVDIARANPKSQSCDRFKKKYTGSQLAILFFKEITKPKNRKKIFIQ